MKSLVVEITWEEKKGGGLDTRDIEVALNHQYFFGEEIFSVKEIPEHPTLRTIDNNFPIELDKLPPSVSSITVPYRKIH